MNEIMPVLTDKEQDNCTPTQQQVEAYLAEPDDELANRMKSVDPKMFRVIAKVILYGRNIAQAQRDLTAPIKDAEISRLLVELKRADKHYTELKNKFDEALEGKDAEIEEILDLLNVHIDNYMDEHGVKKGYGAAYKALSEFRQSLRIKKA